MNQTQQIVEGQENLRIGYYPIRGKAQLCRLICEYLHMPYTDMFFTTKTWQEFQEAQNLNWTFAQIPFLIDEDTVITQTYPICMYLLHKANRKDLLGKTLKQQTKIDSILCNTQPFSYVIKSLINRREITTQVIDDVRSKLWSKHLSPRLTQLQSQATETFYLSEISLVDFYIYELIYYIKIVFPDKVHAFSKLTKIFKRISQIPQIHNYESSNRSIKEICPLKFQD